MASSQHRCVFVGNIPYDATEEQLIQICEEVGPVVSFRLVIDRETGKPKGYGFCEYKDEETALSARRNLQGYEINGRQLRVDFAENDKNADRNREQGRGGPGMVANADIQKQIGGSAVPRDYSLHQPIGLTGAIAAASLMAGSLGGPQVASYSNPNFPRSQPVLGSDPLTLHLAKMSRNQLNEIMSELNVMARKSEESVRQLLVSNPQLLKALLQVEIMLGLVTPQMLRMPNVRPASGPLTQFMLPAGQEGLLSAVQPLPGLPPPKPIKIQSGIVSQGKGQLSAVSQLTAQPRAHMPHVVQSQVPQHVSLLSSTFPSIHSQTLSNVTIKPLNQVEVSSSLKQPAQPPSLQRHGQIGSSVLGVPNVIHQHSHFPRPTSQDQGFQPSSSTLSLNSNNLSKDFDRLPLVANTSTLISRADASPSLPRSFEKSGIHGDSSVSTGRLSKIVKLDDGRSTVLTEDVKTSVALSHPSQVSHGTPNAEKQFEMQLPLEAESALLQQVMNLTPEQLSSLPPDQQQQVIQLQQMLRQST